MANARVFKQYMVVEAVFPRTHWSNPPPPLP